MRMACLVVLAGLALAACDREPTFDASSLPAYQRSLADINARLSTTDQRKLETALLTLAAGQAADYTAVALVNPNSIAKIEFLDGVANPLLLLDRLRPRIDHRTAAVVIHQVADDLDYAIARGEALSKGADQLLGAIVIENPIFGWDRSELSRLTFSIYNGGKDAISGIYLNAELTSRGLAAPMLFHNLPYRFSRPLAPGVQEQVQINLGFTRGWAVTQFNDPYDVDIKIKLANIQDANGLPLFGASADALDTMRRKRDALRGS